MKRQSQFSVTYVYGMLTLKFDFSYNSIHIESFKKKFGTKSRLHCTLQNMFMFA